VVYVGRWKKSTKWFTQGTQNIFSGIKSGLYDEGKSIEEFAQGGLNSFQRFAQDAKNGFEGTFGPISE